MTTADDLACYEHLQVLLARDNELTDIKALGNLESLTHIDVSGNKLTNVRKKHHGLVSTLLATSCHIWSPWLFSDNQRVHASIQYPNIVKPVHHNTT